MALLASSHLNSLVRNLLDKFVEVPEESDALRFGSGKSLITLNNVALKEEPLKELNLPVKLKSSRIGTLRLKMRLHSVMFLVSAHTCCHCTCKHAVVLSLSMCVPTLCRVTHADGADLTRAGGRVPHRGAAYHV